MGGITDITNRIKSKGPLFLQVLFTLLAFAAMAVLSYVFMHNIIHESLVRNANSILAFAETQIEHDLLEPKTALGSFSQTVRSMILRGDDAESLQRYINDISDYTRSSGSRILQTNSFYGFLELYPDNPFFITGDSWVLPEGFDPMLRPWYRMAVEAGGEIVETPPYVSVVTGYIIISYTRSIYDNEGRLLGVTCLNVKLADIARSIVDIALAQGGYGMLLSQDLTVIAHANPEFMGANLKDVDLPLSAYAGDLLAGRDILERPLRNWKGENTIAFCKRLPNGWYLGLLTPEGPFYRDMTNMAAILIVLGSLLAVALIIILVHIDAAKDKSDRESRHKSAFLANMSHEIRTPMNAIIGMTSIGKSAADSVRKDYCFSKIEDASNHLLGVINDILDMSKIEANKFDLSPAEFNFEKMLQRVVNVINFRVDEKKQKLRVHIDQAIPKTLIGDDQRLAQVITNLLGNAVKFTPENGSITVDTSLKGEENGLCTIQVSVSDNGIGITPEQQERVFCSFEQAESSTTRKYGGTGLGLAISKSIVNLMDGDIWVESEQHKGATFSFTVRMQRGTEKKQESLYRGIDWNDIRIMVVDDDPVILEYFREIAQGFGLYCDTALSGEEALRMAESNGIYHIYFVDWKMPGMDGIQLADHLKSRVSADSVVIMISAYEWGAVAEEAKKAGVDIFLSKPLFPTAVADAINESLGMGRRIEEAQANINGLFAGKRILLAEDVDINREIVQSLLQPTQIGIDCAENGREAVELYHESPEKYDIIFMDVQMPEMDGYEATRRIRALEVPDAKKIPIIAMTANVFREDVERCLEAGMNSHVGKPLDFNEVLDNLCTYLLDK